MNGPGCWTLDHNGRLITVHPHFEGRCVAEPMPPDFAERVDAYLEGGWEAWEETFSRQRKQREGGRERRALGAVPCPGISSGCGDAERKQHEQPRRHHGDAEC